MNSILVAINTELQPVRYELFRKISKLIALTQNFDRSKTSHSSVSWECYNLLIDSIDAVRDKVEILIFPK